MSAASVVTDPGRGTASLIVNYVATDSAVIAAIGQCVATQHERFKKSGNGLRATYKKSQFEAVGWWLARGLVD
jgi:hypothetical protein